MLRYTLAFVAALVATMTANAAPIIGLTTTPGSTVANNGDWVLGYSFQVNSAISVVSLGVYDHQANGLTGSHTVGLWNSSGTLLASAVVPSGTGATLDSSYRFTSITGVPLTVGQTYFVGATKLTSDGDQWLQDPSTLVAAPQISYVSRQFQFYTGTLVFPGLAGSGTTGYFGGNFQFEVTAVPEPATLAVFGGIALAGVFGYRRRKATASV